MTFINFKKKYIYISNIKEISYLINNLFISLSSNHRFINIYTFKEIDEYLHTLNFNLNINDFYIFTFIQDPIKFIYNNFIEDINNDYYLNKEGIIYGKNIQSFYSYIKYNHCRNIFNIKDYYYNKDGYLNKNVNIFKIENIGNIINKLSIVFNIDLENIINDININQINNKYNINFDLNIQIKDLVKSRYPIFWSYYYK